ncbi:hypothetical protein L9F63_021617, partial [Diploptera punctata]
MKKLTVLFSFIFMLMAVTTKSMEETSVTIADSYKTDFGLEIWSNISSQDPRVHKIWTSSYKYTKFTRFNKWILDCMKEYNDTKQMAAPFLLMTSIKINTYFLEKYIHYDISKYSIFHDIQKINQLNRDYMQVVDNYEVYSKTAKDILDKMGPEL